MPSMRGTLLLALLLVPWSGCISEPPVMLTSGLFHFEPVVRGDATPVPVADCGELGDILVERARTEALVSLDQSVAGFQGHYRHFEGDVVMAADLTASGPPSTPAGKAQVTGTNNQETGVDEGDIVKTDGEWTYVLDDGMLRILHSEHFGDVSAFSAYDLGLGEYFHGGQGSLLLEPRDPDEPHDDRLVVVVPGQSPADKPEALLTPEQKMAHAGGFTRILVLSLADRKAPTTLADHWVEGTAAGARLIDGVAHVIVHKTQGANPLRTTAWPTEEDLAALGLDSRRYHELPEGLQAEVRKQVALRAADENEKTLAGLDPADDLPLLLERNHGLLLPAPEADCTGILVTPDSTGRGFTTILSLAVAERSVTSQSVQVLGGDPIVYAATDAIVLAAPSQDSWWYYAQPDLEEATDLQWLRVEGMEVTPWASGRVAGIVMDSFALDVHDDTLRVISATGTFNRGWLTETSLFTTVTVFDAAAGLLVPRGTVTGIAPGERLWSVRFTDARAYIVTFEGMDPLWVVDLDGAVPVILGELEVAGVSTYIHPLGDEYLLTIGYGGGDGGLGLDESTILVSLFDVRNPATPRQLDTLDLSPPAGGAWSSALHEHKAFTYWDAVGVLAVPVSAHGGRGGDSAQVGLDLIDVQPSLGRLSLRGALTQDFGTQAPWGAQVERSYFLGEPGRDVSVYAISPLGVTAHDLETLRPQGRVAFA